MHWAQSSCRTLADAAHDPAAAREDLLNRGVADHRFKGHIGSSHFRLNRARTGSGIVLGPFSPFSRETELRCRSWRAAVIARTSAVTTTITTAVIVVVIIVDRILGWPHWVEIGIISHFKTSFRRRR
jgi:hypothetical protein